MKYAQLFCGSGREDLPAHPAVTVLQTRQKYEVTSSAEHKDEQAQDDQSRSLHRAQASCLQNRTHPGFIYEHIIEVPRKSVKIRVGTNDVHLRLNQNHVV